MQLCDADICKAIKNGEIGFTATNSKYPFVIEDQVQPASIDLRLGDIIVRFKEDIDEFDIKDKIDPKKHLDVTEVADMQPIILKPGEIIFGQIYEQMWIGNSYSARIVGRSRVARLGLAIHCTGSYINPGFCGAMPLQIINFNKFPVTIYPYTSICQLVLYKLTGEPIVKYSDGAGIFNPYFNEVKASPSVLRPPQTDIEIQSIAKYRATKLIKEYYRNLPQKNPVQEHMAHKEESAAINVLINNNITGGDTMRDTYFAEQAGIQGPHSGNKATVIMYKGADHINREALLEELDKIRNHIKNDSQNEEDDIIVGNLASAKKELTQEKKEKAISIIVSCGKKLLDIAEKIGCTIVAEIIKKYM